MTKPKTIQKKLEIVLAISATIFVFQMVGGILSNSLALIADSFHILIDFSAIIITLFAFKLAKRPASPKLSFGFHRAEIIAAFINGITFFVLAAFILFEAYHRFFEPTEVEPSILLPFASIGLAANVIMAFVLKKDSATNLNIKGSYLHVLGDLFSSIGVVVGAIILYFVNFYVIDSIISVGIAVLIIRSGVILSRKTLIIFMEGTPDEIKSEDVYKEFENFDEVTEVHDLHVWTLTSNLFAMSVHVKVKPEFLMKPNELLKKINKTMKESCGITHCTIHIESDQDLIKPD